MVRVTLALCLAIAGSISCSSESDGLGGVGTAPVGASGVGTGAPIPGGTGTGTVPVGSASGEGANRGGGAAPVGNVGTGMPSGGGGTGGGVPTIPAMTCGLKKFDLQRQPAELLLVLDRSGSMLETVRDGTVKWPSVTMALDQVIMRTQASVHWGLKLYPADQMCGVTDDVNVPPALGNHGAISGAIAMRAPVARSGSTPTRVAVEKGAAFLKTRTSPNPKYILLATDGQPNCRDGRASSEDQRGSTDAVAAAAMQGFATFVVGIATTGTEAHQTLNDMAVAGTRPRADLMTRYYPAASRDELVTVLETITGQITSCTFGLDQPPPSPHDVAVDVDGMRVARDERKMNGWDYGADNRSIVLHGPPCDRLKSGQAKNAQITFGCPGMIIP